MNIHNVHNICNCISYDMVTLTPLSLECYIPSILPMSFGILPGVTMRQIHASKGPQYRQHVRHTSWLGLTVGFFFGGRSGPILTVKIASNGHLVFQHWWFTIQQAQHLMVLRCVPKNICPQDRPKVSQSNNIMFSKQSLNTVVPKNKTKWVSVYVLLLVAGHVFFCTFVGELSQVWQFRLHDPLWYNDLTW